MIKPDHKLFKSRTDYAAIAAARKGLGHPLILEGYILGLQVAAAACRSHIVSAAEKWGPKSLAVRAGRADLCCIEREIRRSLLMT